MGGEVWAPENRWENRTWYPTRRAAPSQREGNQGAERPGALGESEGNRAERDGVKGIEEKGQKRKQGTNTHRVGGLQTTEPTEKERFKGCLGAL